MNVHSGHNGEVGRANEASLIHLLSGLIPTGFGIGSGVIFDADGSRSGQTDVVIYNQVDQPRILAQSNQVMFPVETVVAAVEVKTSLTVAEVERTGKNIESARKLQSKSTTNGGTVHYSLFAYTCGDSHPRTVTEAINKLPKSEQPDSVCVLNPGAFGKPTSDERVDLVPLHKRDQEGFPVSKCWEMTEKNHPVGSEFPAVGPVSRSRGPKIVTEPGRALLLYAEALIQHIVSDPQHWFSTYLPPVSREIFSIGDVSDSSSET